jgi:hypothetical protein
MKILNRYCLPKLNSKYYLYCKIINFCFLFLIVCLIWFDSAKVVLNSINTFVYEKILNKSE